MMKIITILLMLSISQLAVAMDDFETISLDKVQNNNSKVSMQNWLDDVFGLKPYKANYILPFGIASKPYISHLPDVITYDKKEAEIQVSLKLEVAHNLLGLDAKYYLAYTQQAFWQIYIYSSPFRESLYNPEGFVMIPINDKESFFHIRSLKVAVAHKSNGQPNTADIPEFDGFNLSKSINYFYSTLRLQHQTLITDLTLQVPFPGTDNLSDNPDLMKYLGYTKAKFTYFHNKSMFSLMLRGHIETLKGAAEVRYSYPLRKDKSYFYMKFFTGYVESLIDYNHNITKLSIGVSFSR